MHDSEQIITNNYDVFIIYILWLKINKINHLNYVNIFKFVLSASWR